MSSSQPFLSRKCRAFLRYGAVFAFAMLGAGLLLRAQDAPQGPLEPPPEHHVTRIGNEAEPAAPPSLPEAEIIKRFSEKEDEYLQARTRYIYRRTVRIQEFGPDGKPSGEFTMVTQPARGVDGKYFEKVIEKPVSTLQHFYIRPEDLEGLQKVPPYPLTTGQLKNYELKYLGKEQVDEVDCYIFQVKPKVVERKRANFEGVVWVDDKYLEVVKTYGKWVTDQGDMLTVAALPFSLFETYRENVEGKYWFPDYARSDDTLRIKELQIPVRIVIKWTDFKPAAAMPFVSSPSSAAAPEKPQN